MRQCWAIWALSEYVGQCLSPMHASGVDLVIGARDHRAQLPAVIWADAPFRGLAGYCDLGRLAVTAHRSLRRIHGASMLLLAFGCTMSGTAAS